MASLNEIAYSFAEAVGKSDDIALVRRVKFAIKYYRAKLIRQDFERNGLSRDMLIRIVTPLIKVDEADNPCVKAGCLLLRTKDKVPKPVRTKGSSLFYRVGGIKLTSETWGEVDLNEVKYLQYRTFTKNGTFYYYVNDYLYIITNGKFKYASITAVFADPTKAINQCIDSAECVSDDDEFPIPEDYLDTILKGLMSSELSLQIPEKEVNIDATAR